ncbi:MAG: NlpC/P60 family protein [Paracoccaceae bacterium]
MTILEVQQALLRAGFDPGPLDGVAGPRTRKAIRAFQRRMKLRADGIAGPRTQAALAGGAHPSPLAPGAVSAALPWLAEARRLVGTAEVPGPGNSRTILSWAEGADIAYEADEVPWCGLFVAHCLGASLPDEPLPAQPLGARQWLKFGRPVQPQVGAVLVFWRGTPQGWAGHVGFCWAEDTTHFHVLGGNQSDAVTIARIARGRLLGARWPMGVAPSGLVRKAGGDLVGVSQNEQ